MLAAALLSAAAGFFHEKKVNGLPVAQVVFNHSCSIGLGKVDSFACPGFGGGDGPLVDTFAANALFPASFFDNGSSDPDGDPLFFKVRRTYIGKCSLDTLFDDYVEFCCADTKPGLVGVQFRAYDLDPGPGPVANNWLDGHFSTANVLMEVKDGQFPTIKAPPDDTFPCTDIKTFQWQGNLSFWDNCGIWKIDTVFSYVPSKTLFEQYHYGKILRQFRVTDCAGLSYWATQTYTFNYLDNFRIDWPADTAVAACANPDSLPGPRIWGGEFGLFGISHEDFYPPSLTADCKSFIRKWSLVNWITYNPNMGEPSVINPADTDNGPSTWVGADPADAKKTTFAPADPTRPDSSTLAPRLYVYPESLNGYGDNVNGSPSFRYEQTITILAPDTVPPVLTTGNVAGGGYFFCKKKDNDTIYWNSQAAYNPYGITGTWDPLAQSPDLLEEPASIVAHAVDNCGGKLNWRYVLYLDLNGDGAADKTIDSYWSGSLISSGYGFDIDVIEKNKYGQPDEARVTRDQEQDDQSSNNPHSQWKTFQFPAGHHRIRWTVTDRCGNSATTEVPIDVADCTPPKIKCRTDKIFKNATLTGQSPQVVIPARSLLLGQPGPDDFTPTNLLQVAARDTGLNPGTGFPLRLDGMPFDTLRLTCPLLGHRAVEVFTRDLDGNAASCLVDLYLLDTSRLCDPPAPFVYGAWGHAKTAKQWADPVNNPDGISGVSLSLYCNPALPLCVADNQLTIDDGGYSFFPLNPATPFLLTPLKGANALNGVSTFDLVAISKHVLNVQKFTSPFQHIAADVNRNGQVTTFDIVELRKLILGIYFILPQNDSWRFIDRDFQFKTSNPAGESFPERASVTPLAAPETRHDFTGVKIGDVNFDANPSNLDAPVVDRSLNGAAMTAEDRDFSRGDVFEIAFSILGNWPIAQFTLRSTGLDITEIAPENGCTPEDFALFPTENRLTASIMAAAAPIRFRLKCRATADGSTARAFWLEDVPTSSAAWAEGEEKAHPLELSFLEKDGSAAAPFFRVFQNEPNPFSERTIIEFILPEAADVALTVSEPGGRIVLEKRGRFERGRGRFPIEKSELPTAAAVLFCRVSTGREEAAIRVERF